MMNEKSGTSMARSSRNIGQETIQYIQSHGYQVVNEEPLLNLKVQGMVQSGNITNSLIRLAAEYEDDKELPKMYKDLVNFVDQVPKIQYLQLKPLLFAFFYHTVIRMYKNHPVEASEFFEEFRKPKSDGTPPFHNFQDGDIKKLANLLNGSNLGPNANLSRVSFSASLTETTYQALAAFLMDKDYSSYLSILDNCIKITYVPLDHFTSRPDLIPLFICHSTEQSDTPLQPVFKLLADNPYDLASKMLGCNFSIFDDDDATRITPTISLPRVLHDRVLSMAADMKNMAHLSKNRLPSIAYFTFTQENNSYDINGAGTLIAVATERGYTKLFATCAAIDIDDDLKFSQLNSSNNHYLVPRCPAPVGTDGHYCYRTLIGPRTYCTKFSPESRLLLCGGANVIRLWNCESAGAFSENKVNCGIVWCGDWSPFSYHYATGSDDCCAYLWALDQPKPLRLFVNHQEAITDIKYHPNGCTIGTASYDRSVLLWDIRGNNDINPCTRKFADSVDVPRVIAFTRNGRILITGDEAGKISTWDIGEDRKIGTVNAHNGEVRDLAVSIEGTLLASTGANGEVLLWDMGTLCSTTASGADPLKRFMPRRAETHRISFSNRNLLHAIGTAKAPKQ